MRLVWMVIGMVAANATCMAQNAATEDAAREDAGRLVREVVYNEQHEHAQHRFFRYWIEQSGSSGVRVKEQVETADGPIARIIENEGKPLGERDAEQEEARLKRLLHSPAEEAEQREAYQEDEQRVGRILAMLPDAFVYRDAGVADGMRHLQFTPNPQYTAHGIEARVFHGLSGDLWIDLRAKRMRRLEGHLGSNVEFGFGLLGRVERGSWFRLVRTPVNATDWKTEQIELHLNGRALMFKTLAHNTSEQRGGFAEVQPRMSLAQGMAVLEDAATLRVAVRMAPASLAIQ